MSVGFECSAAIGAGDRLRFNGLMAARASRHSIAMRVRTRLSFMLAHETEQRPKSNPRLQVKTLSSDKNVKVVLKANNSMLTLDQLISEATALPDAAKAILIDKIMESMTGQIDRDVLTEGVQKAQKRIAEIDSSPNHSRRYCLGTSPATPRKMKYEFHPAALQKYDEWSDRVSHPLIQYNSRQSNEVLSINC